MHANVPSKCLLVTLYLFSILFCASIQDSFEDVDEKTISVICAETSVSQNVSTCISEFFREQGANSTESYQTSQKILCRNIHYIALRLTANSPVNLIYVVEVLQHEELNWRYAQHGSFSGSTTFAVTNLKEGAKYKIRTWLFTNNSREVLQPLQTEWVGTSLVKDKPLPIEDLWVKKYVPHGDYVDAIIEWRPGEDLSCNYSYVYLLGLEVINNNMYDLASLFTFTMNRLKYNENYTVGVRAITEDLKQESELVKKQIVTPNCLELHKNLTLCVPEKPHNLYVDEIFVEAFENYSIFNLNISWDPPTFRPDHYQLHFDSLNESSQILTITGDNNYAIIRDVKIKHFYQISVTAWSKKGSSKHAIINSEIKHPHNRYKLSNMYVIIAFVALGVGMIVLLTASARLLWTRYREKRARFEQRGLYFKSLEHKNPSYIDSNMCQFEMRGYLGDDWELKTENILLQAVVGQGAFGIVRHGWLKKDNQQIEVAIKMLKNTPTFEELKQFQQELEIMKNVGNHPHLVSLIGFCIKDKHGPLLVVEYCAKGDLQSYLKHIWDKIINNTIQYSDHLNISNAISNRLYDVDPTKLDCELIQPKQLLSFARQIAMGMEYLSIMKILHRDLAARNILVSEDTTVKISDFGLSRDVYTDNVYKKTAGGKLPIRWMAVECLTHQQYTTQSDVWSFGILLWEIVNLGGNPYPGVPTEQLLKLLKAGYRMECPSNCGNEIYNIMSSCWKACPKERPTFTELRKSIEALMENEMEYLHIDINTCIEMNNAHSSKSKEFKIPKMILNRYVRPSWSINK